jgi:hypothetical protein
MSQGVFTRLKRVEFVKGWLTGGTDPADGSVECGDRTAYPLKVTPDQLAEILYRVKDAKLSGALTRNYFFASVSIEVTTDNMPADYYSGTSSDVIVQRSYADMGVPPTNLEGERSIWVADKRLPEPPYSDTILPILLTHGLATGFTQYAESFTIPTSGYYPYGTDTGYQYPAAIEIAFGNHVAWVDNTGSGNPFDSGNELWMEFGLTAFTINGIVAIYVYTIPLGIDPQEGDAGVLTIELSGGASITCQLTGDLAVPQPSTSSLTLTATEWWPYAKAGGPVWDVATGAKL